MFKRETLFILGAGASKPYNYPIGTELIGKIIDNIERDVIYMPRGIYNPHCSFFENKDKLISLVDDNFYNTTEYTQTTPRSVTGKEITGYCIRYKNCDFYRTKIRDITEFKEFKSALIDYAPISIDAFLRDNPKYKEVGKIMIVYSLLKFENLSSFSFNNHPREIELADNWYSCLLNDLLSGCEKPEDLFNNKLDIITFNYDLSLEYCLFNKLRNTQFIQESSIGNKFIETMTKIRIKHVYGQLYQTDDLINYGKYFEENSSKSGDESLEKNSMRRFLKALSTFDNIKTITEERKINSEAATFEQLITPSRDIIIIGFSFDRDNLTTLGFPSARNEYGEFFNDKMVKYLDFGGKMNNLHEQFLNAQQASGRRFNFIRSKSTSITEAYQNDFKIFLYQ